MNKRLITLFFTLFFTVISSAENWKTQIVSPLKGGAIVVQDPFGNTLFSHNADKAMVPASILKIATADAFISKLGKDYTIKTEFYLTDKHYLGVKGFGDPSLTSESLASIAKQLKLYLQSQSINQLRGFWLDTSFFKPHLKVEGQSNSNNPYDSSVGALVANFNTIHVIKSKNGNVKSAEQQTPLTPTAIQLSTKISSGKHRINIGKQQSLTLNYFSELLQFFLKKEGINIPVSIINQPIPDDSNKIFVHESQAISEIIKGLLNYSNNFTANQLMIILGGELKGAPADLNQGKQVITDFLSENIGLKSNGLNHFILEEGSGLSRKNRFTANQIIKLLNHFKPHQALLRVDNNRFKAKTGTLKGISTYAGYMLSPGGESYPFVIMINQSRWGSDRNKVANIMYQGVFKK